MRKGRAHGDGPLLVGSAVLVLTIATPVHAEIRHFRIAQGDLQAALRDFARQSDQQVLYAPDIARGLTTRGYSGDSEAPQALSHILRDTGLAYAVSRSGALLIVPSPPRPPPSRPAAPAPADTIAVAASTGTSLDEVVVTATRRVSTVNHTAMSITALTERTLERLGITTVQDLFRAVPAVTFRRIGGEGNPTIAIRGIASSLGSPTTAIYIDDTPLQKRDNPGFVTGNGTPFPQLFDLDRVEVLRGPQGTLYGASAEGGAIRFVTPAVSLTRYSAYGRGEVSSTNGGDPSADLGLAVGGPIVPDTLGFRASVWVRHTGGYIDHVSLYDGSTVEENTNSGDSRAIRLAVAWQPAPGLRITPALYISRETVKDGDVFWEDIPQYTVNAGYFTNRGVVNGVQFDFPDKLLPGGVFGPYKLGPYKNGSNYFTTEGGRGQAIKSPRATRLSTPTLTIDEDAGTVLVKSITSFVSDGQKGSFPTGPSTRAPAVVPTATTPGFVTVDSHTGEDAGVPVIGGAGFVPILIPGFPQQLNRLFYKYDRDTITQEVRLSSAPDGGRLNWVAGVFYSYARGRSYTWGASNTREMGIFLRGVPDEWFIGNVNLPDGVFTARGIKVNERELAVFGEATYALTSRLSLTAGLRASRIAVRLSQFVGGGNTGVPEGFVGSPGPPAVITDPSQPNHAFTTEPGDDPYTRFSGEQRETPVNPKLSLSFQATPNDLFYLSAAKGYRAGGANQAAPPVNCAGDLAALGLTGIGTPLTYASDGIWSYEVGMKLRVLDGRAQINGSLYYIDWKDPQLAVRLRCAHTYVTNAGGARSRGFDVQAQIRPAQGLTLEGSVSYTTAAYDEDVIVPGPGGVQSIIVARGDSLGAPKWQYTLGGEYRFRLGRRPVYLRADYQYAGPYERGVGPGRVGYDPLVHDGQATSTLSARAALVMDRWELALFGTNLTNSTARLYQGHTNGFALVTATTLRPREVGLQTTYRY